MHMLRTRAPRIMAHCFSSSSTFMAPVNWQIWASRIAADYGITAIYRKAVCLHYKDFDLSRATISHVHVHGMVGRCHTIVPPRPPYRALEGLDSSRASWHCSPSRHMVLFLAVAVPGSVHSIGVLLVLYIDSVLSSHSALCGWCGIGARWAKRAPVRDAWH